MSKYNVVIVGGGIFGAAIFYYLLKSTSQKVLLVEKEKIGSGATGASGGLIRLLHTSPRLCHLASKSLEEFNHFEQKIGSSCGFVKTGFFTIDLRRNLPEVKDNLRLIKDRGGDVECLDQQEIKKRFGHFNMPIEEDQIVIYEANGGYANPLQTCKAYIAAGVKLGGHILEDREVEDIVIRNGRVTGVKSSHGTFEADCVVLATGAWTSRFLKKLGYNKILFQEKQIQIGFYQYPDTGSASYPAICPSFLHKVLGLYGRDVGNNRCLLGLTSHLTQLESEIPHLSIDTHQQLTAVASKFFPWVCEAFWKESRCGVDAYTESQEGIIEFLPEMDGLLVCSGWSGVGFKIVPECAQQAALKVKDLFS